ncbi:MAG: PKD domain-containing protein [Candidatus Hydrothermia bacterium]
MSKRWLFLIIIASLLSCGAPNYTYRVRMTKPQSQSWTINPSYTDDLLNIVFEFHNIGIGMVITNKTNEFIKIPWNEFFFVRTDSSVANVYLAPVFQHEVLSKLFFNRDPRLYSMSLSTLREKGDTLITTLPPQSRVKFVFVTDESKQKIQLSDIRFLIKPYMTGLVLQETPEELMGRSFRLYMSVITLKDKRKYEFEFNSVVSKAQVSVSEVSQNRTTSKVNNAPKAPSGISGANEGVTRVEYIYSVVPEDPDKDSVAVKFIWGDGTESEWTKLVPSGTKVEVKKVWEKPGYYDVQVKLMDSKGATIDLPSVYKVTVRNNQGNSHPFAEQPSGPAECSKGLEYIYTGTASDPDGDSVSIQFIWGDGTESGWSDFVPSGSKVEVKKVWDKPGQYRVRVRAKDTNGLISTLSKSLLVIVK